jgi:hypothetical protein
MGDHDAPASWLERWRAQEPLRLYLWTIASALVAAALVAGWLTAELAVAVTGVVAAVLMVGGTAAARREAYAPATVDRLLEEQHALSFRQGVQEGLHVLEERAVQLPDTVEHPVPEPQTALLRAQPGVGGRVARCRHVEDGRRCTLPRHPEKVDHRLEEVKVGE